MCHFHSHCFKIAVVNRDNCRPEHVSGAERVKNSRSGSGAVSGLWKNGRSVSGAWYNRKGLSDGAANRPAPLRSHALIINNSAADCSILLKFATIFDHVTPYVLQNFKVNGHWSRSQRENIDRNIIALLGNQGNNGDVTISIGGWEIVYAHAFYKFSQNSPKRRAQVHNIKRFQVAMQSQLPP